MTAKRNTKQKSAIEEAFTNIQRPLSPTEVCDLARKQVPRLGIATVYRAINEMVEEGLLRPVDLPGQNTRYEKAGLHHHHHFHCSSCDKVFDLEGCFLKKDLNLPKGFDVIQHDITLTGHCPDCNHDF
ncbi:transcriptional repressor [Kiritimatiellota bacterium B12222]|nr:transcriptional repressor [Kiritimatiellota bacterium B12222]